MTERGFCATCGRVVVIRQPAWSAAIDRARAEIAAVYGIPEAAVGSGCYESGPGPTASTITFGVDDSADRFGHGEDRVTVRVCQHARFRSDGVLELGPLMVSTAPEWLARLFPEVEGWERRDRPHCDMWRGRAPGMFERDQWLYVIRHGDTHLSAVVAGEFVGTMADAEMVEQALRSDIEYGRAMRQCDCSGGRDLHEGQCSVWAALRAARRD